jgi:trehalose 6-phosphate synthase
MFAEPEGEKQARLQAISLRLVARRPLIVASNRGPLEYNLAPDGRLEPRRGAGGVVTALSPLTRSVEFTWVASAMGEGDRRVSQETPGGLIRSPLPGQRVSVRYVVTSRRVYHKYYNIFCNPLLWFLQHYMWNSPYNPNIDASVLDAWDDGYVQVNRAFADVVLEESRRLASPPVVMLHDYHLYLVSRYVRDAAPEAVVSLFVHIPWPTPRYWQLLPANIRRAICESLAAADVVGFQTPQDARNFLDTCEEFLPEARIDQVAREVFLGGRRTCVRAYPISIDVEEVRRIAGSPRALEYEARLKPLCGHKTVVRVDRAEPSKNVVRGFRAFGMLLARHPELHGQVNFLAFLVPSRTHVRQYQRYMEEIDQAVREVNAAYGKPPWQPVTVFYENNYTQAIAGMRLYDVLLVNPVIDGMNLVSKEGPVVNTRDGVLVLSETTGSYRQLAEGALGVAPADLEGTAQALHQALTMDEAERRRRAESLVHRIEREDITHWLCLQLQDLEALL